MFLTIETCITREQNNINEELIYKHVDWRKFDRNEYCNIAESNMMSIDICDKIGCTENHDDKIDNNFDVILNALHTASEKFTVIKRKSFNQFLGGTRTVVRKNIMLLVMFLSNWLGMIDPEQVAFFDRLKATKKDFINP